MERASGRIRASRVFLAAAAFAAFIPQAQAAPPYATNLCTAERVSNLNCTANDVEVARLAVLNNVTTCVAGEPVTLDLQAYLHLNSQDRHDVGIFLAKDGKFPNIPTASGGSADCAVFGIPQSPPPFADLDTNACGDFDRDGLPQGTETSYHLPSLVTVTCKADPEGYLDIPTVISWQTGGTASSCQSPPAAWVEPENSSKCEVGVAARIEVQVQGRIVITKQTNPDAAAGSFSFTATGTSVSPTAFSLIDGQEQTVTTAPLGPTAQDYVITEQQLAGWESGTTIVCTDAGNMPADFVTVDNANRTITAHMTAAFSEAFCTFTNTKLASITIDKTALGGNGSFNFTGSTGVSPFTITTSGGSGQQVISGLAAGNYTVTETIPSGWDLTDLACVDPTTNSSVNLATATASIDLGAGENVTCTYTDTKRASITVVKNTVGGNGTFDFTGPGGAFQITTTAGTGQVELTNLQPGTYNVSESVPSGWDLATPNCVDPSGGTTTNANTAVIGLAAGENVTCTFTDTKRGAIVIAKQVLGPDATFDFTGSQVFSITTTGGNGQNTAAFASVIPGTYTVTESALAGWDVTGLSCADPTSDSTTDIPGHTASVHVAAGETVTCTFTNTRLATLTIIKQAVPHVANPNTQSFGFTATGLLPASFSLSDDGVNTAAQTQTFTGLLPGGAYQVTETLVANWPLTSLVCSDQGDADPTHRSTVTLATRTVIPNLQPGETLECVFTNARNDNGSIAVTKTTIGGGGSFDFTNSGGSAGSATNPAAFNITTTAQNLSGSQQLSALTQGTYVITEAAQTGWDLAPIQCQVTNGSSTSIQVAGNAVTINLGTTGANVDAVACEFTNTKRGSITIVKQATPQDAQDFTFLTTGGNGVPASFALDDDADNTLPNTASFPNLLPGVIYTFTEQAVALWRLTDIACSGGSAVTTDPATGLTTINLNPGEDVSCTYHNAKDGTITITKVAGGGSGGETFTFTGPGTLSGSIATGQNLSGHFAAGTYTVTEIVPAGWDLTNIACTGGTVTITGAGTNPTDAFEPGDTMVNITIASGQAVSCTYTDTRRGSITIVKNTIGGDGAFSFTGAKNFQIQTSAGTGQDATTFASVPPGTYAVTEILDPTWKLTTVSCSDGSATSVPNRTATVVVSAGENVTCTFTDTRQGSITIVKRIHDDATTTFNFTVPAALDAAGTFGLTPAVEAAIAERTFENVAPGTYTVTEVVPAGWLLTGLTCTDPTQNTVTDFGAKQATINLAAGETVECVFDDTRLSTITVSVVSEGGVGNFPFASTNLGAASFSLQTVGSGIKASRPFSGLPPGTYTVDGLGLPIWTLVDLQCTSESGETYWLITGAHVGITIPHGEVIECIYYYRLTPPPTSIPVMSPWMYALLGILLVGVGVRQVRVRLRKAVSRRPD